MFVYLHKCVYMCLEGVPIHVCLFVSVSVRDGILCIAVHFFGLLFYFSLAVMSQCYRYAYLHL